jgi:ubiquinone/menaquinone biosynthesis C-methylase UbiE
MLRPEGEPLWRAVADVGGFTADLDVLEVGSGTGDSLCFWAKEYAIDGTGVDADPRSVEAAEERARELSLSEHVQFQNASPGDLPFRDGSFDAAVGGAAIEGGAEWRTALAELVRVVRNGGAVLFLHWAWAPDVAPAQRALVRRTFGVRARSSEEWQRLLAAEGVGNFSVHPISEVSVALPHDVLRTRLHALPRTRKLRAWGRFAGMIRREREARRLLASGNVLGVTLIKGTKWP